MRILKLTDVDNAGGFTVYGGSLVSCGIILKWGGILTSQIRILYILTVIFIEVGYIQSAIYYIYVAFKLQSSYIYKVIKVQLQPD